MTLSQAAFVLAVKLMGNYQQYDKALLEEVVSAITSVTNDLREVETLIRIARWESGGFRLDIADCRVRGDDGAAHGIFQIHPFSSQEMIDSCSRDYAVQARLALKRVRDSFLNCKIHGYSGSDLLGEYTCGHCHRGDAAAKLRYGDGKELQRLIYTEDNVVLQKRHS